jgi:hypothetical protein
LLFWRLDLLEPWGDEWFTLTTAPQPLTEIASIVAGNIHPPLYFFLLHFWIGLPWPGTALEKMRAMSGVWTLVATVILYYLWLRPEHPGFRRIVLALWVLSPCLLLYARMARSYSMQLALALLSIYAALQWADQPRDWRRFLGYTISCIALLYTHYLPGLAVLAVVSVMLLFQKRWMAVAGSTVLILLLYLPWLATMRSASSAWMSSEPYRVGNFFIDQIVRIGYWFVSLSFGETLSTPTVLLGVVMTPVMVYALWRAVQARPKWFGLVTAAGAIGYIGVSRWSGFPFTPARLLFVLPFFLILLARELKPATLAGLGILYISADYSYFTKTGYLNKAYCAPYEEVAAIIRNGSPQGAVVMVDADSLTPQPLADRLGSQFTVIPLGVEAGRAPLMWVWRHTRDTPLPGREVRTYGFLPYTLPERFALRLLRGPGQPEYFYQLSEIR